MSIIPIPDRAKFVARSRPVAPTAKAVPSAPMPGILVRLLCIFFIIFDFPGFTMQLALDATGRWVGSPILQVITISSELFVIGVILGSTEVRALIARCWPIWLLIGLAFLSAIWSRNPAATVHAANTYMTVALFGVALVGLFPGFECVKLIIRTMAIGCLLSIIWVVLIPEVAVHQLTDPYQTVHAGLWRGIFSHKQGLGLFAGLTAGLLIFYRTAIYPMLGFLFFLGCAVACVFGTGSATGLITMLITPVVFLVAQLVARLSIPMRAPAFVKFAVAAVLLGVAFKAGTFDYVIVQILGKSTDMTGRADIWPIVLQNFSNSGYAFLGGGFGADIASDLSEWSVDNGFIDKYLEFGVLFSPLVYFVFAATLWWGIRLIVTTPNKDANADVFPFAMWSIILIANYTESNFMAKNLCTVLTSIALGLLFSSRLSSQPRQYRARASSI
jgi:exopolysaccharide production protein ExoQ